jgi:hypothetical protein
MITFFLPYSSSNNRALTQKRMKGADNKAIHLNIKRVASTDQVADRNGSAAMRARAAPGKGIHSPACDSWKER